MKHPAIVLGVVLLAACGGSASQEDLLENISEAEAVLERDTIAVPQHALDAAQAFLDYVHAFPEDSTRNPRFWFKAAQLFNVAGQPREGLGLTDSLFHYFPDHESIPTVLHFRGTVYETALGDIEKARKEFERITTEYNMPENYEIVAAALGALQYLGMSGAEIYEELRAQGLIEE